jgi:two-component system, OmpR family, response regulator
MTIFRTESKQQAEKESRKTRNAISVFLVDDSSVYLSLLQRHLLEQLQPLIKVDAFSNGEDCLKEIERNPTVEIVILDYYLNGELPTSPSGFTVLKEIKRINSNILVVMLSREDRFDIAKDCITFGAYEYVVKGATAFIRTENILKNLIREVRLQTYYPSDLGGEA